MTDIQTIVLCAAGAQILFEYFLRNANERHLLDMKETSPPDADGLMDEITWKKATDYSIAKSRFSTCEDVFGFFSFHRNHSLFVPQGLFPLADIERRLDLVLFAGGDRLSHRSSDPQPFLRLVEAVYARGKIWF